MSNKNNNDDDDERDKKETRRKPSWLFLNRIKRKDERFEENVMHRNIVMIIIIIHNCYS